MPDIRVYKAAIEVLELSLKLHHRIDKIVNTFNVRDKYVTKSGEKVLRAIATISFDDVRRVRDMILKKEQMHMDNPDLPRDIVKGAYKRRIMQSIAVYNLYHERVDKEIYLKSLDYAMVFPGVERVEPDEEKREYIIKRLVNRDRTIPYKYVDLCKQYIEVLKFKKSKHERIYIEKLARGRAAKRRAAKKAEILRRIEERPSDYVRRRGRPKLYSQPKVTGF